ncbi:DUF4175 family protein [Chitinophaga nivalis]|uniref:DUF4175 domain-containing protein n=1 Tax=Chitinophaga nivalis TaxID=2991709 RepID=A0ABT3IHE3_9BACT|nr:DUF4175 family protein [Chitinophaga nivalis]MCW3466930.1 hypothetical protein [Chitinophaga nivalis]MCW3483379.1 hypothetical protein [Chitinophaga nivalis]
MANGQVHTMIERIRSRWIRLQWCTTVLLSLAVALPLLLLYPLYSIGAGVLLLGIRIGYKRPWELRPAEVARYLDQTFPALEDSTGLLLRSADNGSLLEQLQARKVATVLEQLQLPAAFYRPLKRAALLAGGALVAGIVLYYAVQRSAWKDTLLQQGKAIVPAEKTIPGMTAVQIQIRPPAYTRKAVREQHSFHITAEDSAQLYWKLQTNIPVTRLVLLFNDSTTLSLQPDKDSTTWTATRLMRRSGFYQVQLNHTLSERYQLQLLPDHPPVVKILTPAPYTVIEFGQSTKVNIQTELTDDYGIREAWINVTIASGSGEAVRFREQRIALDGNLQRQEAHYRLNRLLQLTSLGMKPGDECYFYVAATDTRLQQTRSDIYIITLPDTAQLFSMEGLVNGVNFKPEYFRSQRQIIMDAEQLIRERDTLGKERFNARSNELGTDQKLLRLRYGKFLGEESESNIGDPRVAAEGEHEHDHGHDHGATEDTPASFGDAAGILDQFTDKHDNAEDATFLDIHVKQQLKNTLTEMWKSELQLRLYKPQEALPYAYKALRLLKDLQQQSRVFVAKTGVKTTPLKPEKRLTGEQDKINPAIRKETKMAKDEQEAVRIALSVLSQGKPDVISGQQTVLQQAAGILSTHAAAAPALYLPALEALYRITGGRITAKDLTLAQQGLQHLLPVPARKPAAGQRLPDTGLSDRYFNNLKATHR